MHEHNFGCSLIYKIYKPSGGNADINGHKKCKWDKTLEIICMPNASWRCFGKDKNERIGVNLSRYLFSPTRTESVT